MEPEIINKVFQPDFYLIKKHFANYDVNKYLIILTSISVRVIISMIFFGGIDSSWSLVFSASAANHQYFYLPYFPLITNWLALSARIANHITFFSPQLIIKLFPILMDGLIPLLFLNSKNNNSGHKIAWAYAVCPLPILVTCFIGQWESLWILPTLIGFKAVQKKINYDFDPLLYVYVGCLFAIGTLAKTLPIFLLPIVLEPFASRKSLNNWIKNLLALSSGFFITFSIFLLIFRIEGLNLPTIVKNVFLYTNGTKTVFVFGLIRLRFFSEVLNSGQIFHVLSLLILLALICFYHMQKQIVNQFAFASVILLALPAIGGYAPQYLLWPFAFLLMSGTSRLIKQSFYYAAFCSFLLILYCAAINAPAAPGDQTGAFLPINSFRFLSLPLKYVEMFNSSTFYQHLWLPIANIFVPLTFTYFAYIVIKDNILEKNSKVVKTLQADNNKKNIPILIAYFGFIFSSIFYYSLGPTNITNSLINIFNKSFAHLATTSSIHVEKILNGPNGSIISMPKPSIWSMEHGSLIFNIFNILVVFTVIWFFAVKYSINKNYSAEHVSTKLWLRNFKSEAVLSIKNEVRSIISLPKINNYLKIFIAALIVRLTVSTVFLGSCDTLDSLTNMVPASLHQYFYTPYFPLINQILSFEAFLATKLSFIPIGLFPKIIPCIVDSLIATWLLRNSWGTKEAKRKVAWSYVFCPLPIYLVCIHGQWDSLWVLASISGLLYSARLNKTSDMNNSSKYFIVGAVIGFSILCKPSAFIIAGLAAPIFRSARTNFWFRELISFFTGITATLIVGLSIFAIQGFNIAQSIKDVFNYGAAQNVGIVFGLAKLQVFQIANPITYNLNFSTVSEFRYLATLFALLITLFHVFSKKRNNVMLLASACLIVYVAIGGLAPQYIFWPLVFLLASGQRKIALRYAAISSIFLFLFYLIPSSSSHPGENFGAFLPIKTFGFLGIPTNIQNFVSNNILIIRFWNPFLNLCVPLFLIGFSLYLFFGEKIHAKDSDVESTNFMRFSLISEFLLMFGLLGSISIFYSCISTTSVGRSLMRTLPDALSKYSFKSPIYSWEYWTHNFYWSVNNPLNSLIGGNLFGSIVFLAPFAIFSWIYYFLNNTQEMDAV